MLAFARAILPAFGREDYPPLRRFCMFFASFLSISLFALVAGIVAHMVIGMFWYSPMAFGQHWMNLCKIKASSIKMHSGHILGSAITGGTITIALGHILKTMGTATCLGAIETSLILWPGFVATTIFSPVLWQKRPMELYLITIAHWAVSFSVIGCIVTKLYLLSRLYKRSCLPPR